MRKFFGFYDNTEEKTLKNKMMSFTDILPKYISFLDVYVNEEEYLHVTLIDDTQYKNKKDLVMFHGLSGSSIMYFKCFKALSKYFTIYAVDLPNQGL